MTHISGSDPYAGILLEMRSQAEKIQPPGWCLGTVLSVAGGLRIFAGGQELDGEDLLVDPSLLEDRELPFFVDLDLDSPKEGAASSVTLDVGGTYVRTHIQVGQVTISSIPLYELPGKLSGKVSGKLTITGSRLAVGDKVVLLPDREGQLYYVVCKVVRP